MTHRHFAPGFRLSKLDVVMLITGGAAALRVAPLTSGPARRSRLSWGIFLLFCNVLRMSRPLELVWATRSESGGQ